MSNSLDALNSRNDASKCSATGKEWNSILDEAVILLNFSLANGYTNKEKYEITAEEEEPIRYAEEKSKQNKPLDMEERIRFDQAYNKLAIKLYPITATTIKSTSIEKEHRKRSAVCLFMFKMNAASLWAFKLWYITLLLVIVLAFSISSVETKPAGQNGAGAQNNEAAEHPPPKCPDGINADPCVKSAFHSKLGPYIEIAIHTVEDVIMAFVWLFLNVLKSFVYALMDTFTSIMKPAGGFFAKYRQYIIPFIVGGIGACAYLIRDCYTYIVERKFDPAFTPQYYLRIALGILAGGSLILFQSMITGPTTNGATPPATKNLSEPSFISLCALAFIFGFSSEPLFQILEAASKRFSLKDGSPGPAQGSPAGSAAGSARSHDARGGGKPADAAPEGGGKPEEPDKKQGREHGSGT